jgi:hypothetical protein
MVAPNQRSCAGLLLRLVHDDCGFCRSLWASYACLSPQLTHEALRSLLLLPRCCVCVPVLLAPVAEPFSAGATVV